MKNKWMKIGGAALMTVAIVAAVIQHVRADESVKVSRLTSVKLKETFTTSGKLESAKKQEVYVQPERGEIKRVLVETGEKVAKGDRLVEYEGAAGGSTFVTSKMNGTVVRAENILVSGQGGNGPIVVVADMSQLKVVANISEFDIMKVKVGQSARVMTEAMPEKGWQGKVKDVGMLPNEHGLAEDEQVTYPVEITLGGKPPFKIGTKLIVDIVTSNAEAMSLPATAVVEREEQQVVYVVREGKAVEKAVRVGKRNEQWVEILSGLLASDQVVVNPSKGLVNGMDVNVQ